MEKNNKKIINAWSMYDWANSVYSLVITATIFPIYYSGVTENTATNNLVEFFGISIQNTALYSYSLSLSFIIIAFIAPPLSGLADFGGKRKLLWQIFAYIGAASCIALFFFTESVEYGIICSVLASIGFAGSLVFYNAYLPSIATPDKFDQVSAKGFSMGYAGSIILLIVALVLIQMHDFWGFENEVLPTRLSFLLTGLWWFGFSLIPFAIIPSNVSTGRSRDNLFKKGFQEINKVIKTLPGHPNLGKFLLAFFLYNTGVQTIIYLATLFGSIELKLESGQLIITILIIQLVAIAGAYIFAKLSGLKGNKYSLSVMIILWVVVCVAAYFVTSAIHFYALAFLVGLVMGGIQSLSRATYSKLIPDDTLDHTSYFSFYDVTEKISIVIGTVVYGVMIQITGGMRLSSVALSIFFIAGLVVLLQTYIPHQKAESKILSNSL
ncbi:MAG: MFS transporter [Cyclobacteriaceae bacterium]